MTGPLKNARHERFAQERARGKSQAEAYALAGYRPNEGGASRLAGNVKVRDRVTQLQAKAAEKAAVDAAWVLKKAVALHDKAMEQGALNPAARALELVGKHVDVQAFKERLEHSGRIDFAELSDEEIDARIAAHEAANAGRPTAH